MHVRWQRNCLWAVALLVLSGWCHAQSVTPEDEYKNQINIDQTIHPLGEHPFGENISLYDGTLSFEETDISVPGNGPTIRLGRTLTPGAESNAMANVGRAFGDWDLDIPRIETYTAVGWRTVSSATLRCTDFGVPPTVSPTQNGGDPWSPDQWWFGYHLMVPGEGSQTLLVGATPKTINGTSFSILTKQNWMIGCGVTASDGGEGFQAVAPDGTQYTFARLVYQPMMGLTSPLGTPPQMVAASTSGIQPMVAPDNILSRMDGLMYVTQIKDRFGNTLTYNYDSSTGYLDSITASDGREVDIAYASGSPRIQSITVKAANVASRSWTYLYDTTTDSAHPILTGVQLPDGSAWSYQLRAFLPHIETLTGGNCQIDQLPVFSTDSPVTGTITHPSGLTGTFTLTPMLHGRSYVPKTCWGYDPSSGTAPYADMPNYSYQYSLTSEVVSGAGIPAETWSYSYSPANRSWTTDTCASTNSCPSLVYTDVTDPGGNDTRYTFSNRFGITEGQLQRTDYYSGSTSGPLLRSVANQYAGAIYYGFDLQDHDNRTQVQNASPLNQRTIAQDGQTYTWQATAFDAYLHPTDVIRSSNITGQASIEETTAYLNDTNLWVLGLPQTVTNVGTGEVETSNSYNSLDELTARARFGETLMNYTWNSAGQLASFTDGNSHTTNLSDYYRGIPRSIGYPDGTSEALAVDDLGQITSITDQAGHTTGYSYDAIGRIAQINYPYDSSVDSAQWYPKVFTYAYVTGAERGVAAGHWRRTTTQGSATDTTYFDAELRPVLDDTSNGSTDISTATGYDWRGLTTFAAYPVAGSPDLSALTTGTHSSYDALGRPTQTQQDSELGTLTSTTAYLSGGQKQVTDPKGNVTTTAYQMFDQPSYSAPILVQAPTGITQTISRDVYGNPLSITQSGNYGTESDSVTKTLIYDSYRRLCRTTEPETGSTVMAYDGANNLAWSAEGQNISGTACSQGAVATTAQTVRSYDAMNRVLTIVPPAGTQSTTYTYDALGNVSTALSGATVWVARRDSLGQITQESLQVAGQNPWTYGYQYDAYGHLGAIAYPTGETVSYAPDAWGRPTQAGSYVTGVGYFPSGAVSIFTYGNGASYVAEQNARQLLSNFSYGTDSALRISEDYAYDADGNITQVNDLLGGLRSKSFGYDALNRLTSATASNLYGTESYTYDPINNLRTRLTQGQTLTYNYDASNKLASITQGATAIDSLTYDAQGDTIGQNSTTLAYDAKHQLTGLPGVESYSYDAAGRRVMKQPANGSPTYYFYSQAGQLLYQWDTAANTSTNFIYLGKKLVAKNAQSGGANTGSTGVSVLFPPAYSTTGNYTVSWYSISGATSYELQTLVNGAWTTVYTGSANAYGISATANGVYAYRVRACAGGNCGAWSNTADVTVDNQSPVTPPVLSPLLVVNRSNVPTSYTVLWAGVDNASSYNLQEQFQGGTWTTVYSGPNGSWDATNKPVGTYAYQVQACNSAGCGPWSPAVSIQVSVDISPIINLILDDN